MSIEEYSRGDTQERLRCASFNVLADAYLEYGNYSMGSGLSGEARIPKLISLINSLGVDIAGLQEAEQPLLEGITPENNWQTFWSQKGGGKKDGCLTLVKPNIEVTNFREHYYDDRSGNLAQILQVLGVTFVNTHIRWGEITDENHLGISQVNELIRTIGSKGPVVILADCNDSNPKGPVRSLLKQAGFYGTDDNEPTALVNGIPLALDIIAVRGIKIYDRKNAYEVSSDMPNQFCPSDHVPIVADIGIA